MRPVAGADEGGGRSAERDEEEEASDCADDRWIGKSGAEKCASPPDEILRQLEELAAWGSEGRMRGGFGVADEIATDGDDCGEEIKEGTSEPVLGSSGRPIAQRKTERPEQHAVGEGVSCDKSERDVGEGFGAKAEAGKVDVGDGHNGDAG